MRLSQSDQSSILQHLVCCCCCGWWS